MLFSLDVMIDMSLRRLLAPSHASGNILVHDQGENMSTPKELRVKPPTGLSHPTLLKFILHAGLKPSVDHRVRIPFNNLDK